MNRTSTNLVLKQIRFSARMGDGKGQTEEKSTVQGDGSHRIWDNRLLTAQWEGTYPILQGEKQSPIVCDTKVES